MTRILRISGGGAAKALVESLADWLQATHDARIEGEFSAVGAIRDKFLRDHSADVLILSDALIRELAAMGELAPESVTPIGGVQTGVQCFAGPSGWHLLGRTPVRTYQLHSDPIFLLEPGDRVTFSSVDAKTFAEQDRAAEAGEIVAELMPS